MEDKMLDHLFQGVDINDSGAVDQRWSDLVRLQEHGFLPQDEEPDVWADEHPEFTEEEMALGQTLGERIDIDDDEDNGGVS